MEEKFDCPRCGERLHDDWCRVCGREIKDTDTLKRVVGEHRDHVILLYKGEKGVRVDFGTARSKEVSTIEEARKLIDYHHSPDKWKNDSSEDGD
ncbi:hypothetical protein NYE54_09190 [Paenibacillus sp. FSL K6-1330]|uniref:hypothetical protein n=1 Tax=Paenibacillus sp. FSL K6-1330 TaxID=2975292 RepID=UPI0030DCDA97